MELKSYGSLRAKYISFGCALTLASLYTLLMYNYLVDTKQLYKPIASARKLFKKQFYLDNYASKDALAHVRKSKMLDATERNTQSASENTDESSEVYKAPLTSPVGSFDNGGIRSDSALIRSSEASENIQAQKDRENNRLEMESDTQKDEKSRDELTKQETIEQDAQFLPSLDGEHDDGNPVKATKAVRTVDKAQSILTEDDQDISADQVDSSPLDPKGNHHSPQDKSTRDRNADQDEPIHSQFNNEEKDRKETEKDLASNEGFKKTPIMTNEDERQIVLSEEAEKNDLTGDGKSNIKSDVDGKIVETEDEQNKVSQGQNIHSISRSIESDGRESHQNVKNAKQEGSSISGAVSDKRQTTVTNNKQIHKKSCNQIPDVLIIGFEKCGTMTLKEFMSIHPQIFAPVEPNDRFFNPEKKNMTLSAYKKGWPCTPAGLLKLEKMAIGGLPSRVYQLNKNMKLIVIVKDPVTRAVSHFRHRVALGYERTGTFGTVIQNLLDRGIPKAPEKSILFNQGMYSTKLKPWLHYFPKDRIHIVDGSNFVKNPVTELQMVESFLKVKPYVKNDHFVFNKHKGFYCIRGRAEDKCMGSDKGRPHPSVNPSILQRLKNFFRDHNTEFFSIFHKHFPWND